MFINTFKGNIDDLFQMFDHLLTFAVICVKSNILFIVAIAEGCCNQQMYHVWDK